MDFPPSSDGRSEKPFFFMSRHRLFHLSPEFTSGVRLGLLVSCWLSPSIFSIALLFLTIFKFAVALLFPPFSKSYWFLFAFELMLS